ncbi:xanthine dehydrogenase family protein molybdopterin-binding subunit [Limibacillus halophilus]|uniref:Carbon-monoxide dehydrogenase large subunit n=1 Tax=Limibacillus halophilus TaxID=1579333 RepID=A0A839T1F4_9PROT|nr:xanthine dehydrogenase family protein molybdopterin-binding subunit [Limibacillus halophilus]MBB3066973.1 carbon-monoxide dehydrogenase large subunit [Limibacillus halophilus]
MKKFGVGQPLRRFEDQRLLTGEGSYTDDQRPEGALQAVVLRSPHAHAVLASIDCEDARAFPGVRAVYTHAELDAAGIGDIPCLTLFPGKGGKQAITPGHPVLARGKVRHVGDPVAFVVAETLEQAQDAAEAIMVDFDDLEAVVDLEAAIAPGAPQVFDEVPGNVCFDWDIGDAAKTEALLESAERVVELSLVNSRIVVNSLEPRNAIGEYDPASGRFTLTTSTQGVFKLRDQLADKIFKLPRDRFRVLTPDVGGGFGMKIFLYAEQVLVLFAARDLGLPVVWNGTRSESFQSDSQGRDHLSKVRVGLDAQGRMKALHVSTLANLGGYLSNFGPYIPTAAGAKMLSGLYGLEAVYCEVKCVLTHTVPVDAYRGAGRPEAAYLLERLADYAATEIGLTPEEFRRRNFIPKTAMPFDTATGITYDSGDFTRVMERALEKADWSGSVSRKEAAAKAGRYRGIGIGCYIEACAGIGEEEARVRLDEDGGMTVFVGTQTNGQGHATAYAQIMAEQIGIDPAMVRLRQGDSDELSQGSGTGGSRSLLMGRLAIEGASEKVIERLRRIAGFLLEAAPEDIELADAKFAIVGTDRHVGLAEIARKVYAQSESLPEALRGEVLEAHIAKNPPLTYPNGCHVCELEIDPETGRLIIDRYTVVDDFGTIVNPLLVAGQVHGGLAQGLGQALLEVTAYDPESGQLLTGSFMDYGMPRADDMPRIDLEFIQDIPCATNPFGIKGAGEAGAIGAPPAIVNALVDALKPLGVRHLDMPVTPEKLWRLANGLGDQKGEAAE